MAPGPAAEPRTASGPGAAGAGDRQTAASGSGGPARWEDAVCSVRRAQHGFSRASGLAGRAPGLRQGTSGNSLEDELLLLVVLGADERRDLLHVVLQPVEDGAHRPHDLVVARPAGRDGLGDDAREDLALRGERDDAVARDGLVVPAQGLGVAEVLVDALLAVCARGRSCPSRA